MKMLFIVLFSSTLTALTALPQLPPLRFSLETFTLNLSNCFAEPGHVGIPLGTTNRNIELIDWSCASAPTNHTGTFELRLAKPMSVGSIISYGTEKISYACSNDWKSLPATESTNFLLRVGVFPPDALIDTIRISAPATHQAAAEGKPDQYQATLPFCTLIPARTVNVARNATVTTSSAAKKDPARPWLNEPETLVDGFIDAKENFSSAPRESEISTNSPEWLLLTWPQPQSIRGMAVLRGSADPGLGDGIAETFTGAGDPAASTGTDDWITFKGRATAAGRFRQHQWVVSFESVTTRALRLRTVGAVKQIGVGEILVLSDLGSAPVPAVEKTIPPSAEPDPAKKP